MVGAGVEWPGQVRDEEMRSWKSSPYCQASPLPNKSALTVRVVMKGDWADYELRSVALFPVSDDAWLWSDATNGKEEIKPNIEQRWVLINKGVVFDAPLIPAKPQDLTANSSMARDLFHLVPDAATTVPHPCTCGEVPSNMLWQLVQHLNDTHHPDRGMGVAGDAWSRERIADWLDTLDLDLSVDAAKAEEVKARREAAIKTRLISSVEAIEASMESIHEGASIAAQKFEMLSKMMEPMPEAWIWKQFGPMKPETTKEES